MIFTSKARGCLLLLLLLLLLLCSSSLLSGGVAAVNIGAIVDPNSRMGREQKVAVEIAAQDFNNTGSILFLKISNSSSDPFITSSNAYNLIKDWGADAIIATGTWPEASLVARVGNQTRVPVISLATTEPLSIGPPNWPNLFRMSHRTSSQMNCVAALLKSYNLRRAIVIYEDDDYSTISGTMASPLSDALQSVGTDTDYTAAFPPMDSLPNPKARVRQGMEGIRQRLCKAFIVVRSSPTFAIHLFKEASAMGMMDKGSVWIVNDDIASLLDSSLSPSFISSYMQGVIGIKTYFDETSESYLNFRAKFRQRFPSEYGNCGRADFEPGISALQAYDAVHAIAEGIRSSNFVGLSGSVRFGSDGSLVVKSLPTYRVLNVVGKSYKELGFWSEKLGFHKEKGRFEPMVDQLVAVYWPGGPTKVPGGWGSLRIGVPANTAFDQFVKVEYDDQNKTEVTGFCIEVFKMARQELKYELPYAFEPFVGSYDDLVARIPEKYDAVVGDITILAKRSANVTFTEPFLASGLSMLVPVRPEHTPWMLTKPFTKAVWILIATTLVYTSMIVWRLEHKWNPEFDGPWWSHLGATLWLIFSSIFFAHGRIHSYYTKAVIIAWLFTVLILSQCYTASLSSILTAQKLEPIVRDLKVGCDGDSFVLKYLQQALGYKEQKIEKIGSQDDYPSAFRSGNISAAYLETPYLRVFLSRHDGYTVYGETHRLGGFGFAFPKGSPLAADFSRVILELSENGTLKQLEDKWFSFSLTNCPKESNDRNKDSLSLSSFWALFLFTGGTSTIVILIFKALSFSACAQIRMLKQKSFKWWQSKLQRWEGLQLSHLHSSSSHVAPEPNENFSMGARSHDHHESRNLPNDSSV